MMSFEEWTEVMRKLNEEPVIEFVHSSDSQISKLVRVWLPDTWSVREETNDNIDSQVFLIIGRYEYEPRGEERFERKFVELWLYDRFSRKLSCRRQVITTYPDLEGGLKEVPSPYVWKDREEIELKGSASAAAEGFMVILNEDIFRSRGERRLRKSVAR